MSAKIDSRKGSGETGIPTALSDSILVANGASLYLMDGQRADLRLYKLPADLADAGAWIHEPRPLHRQGQGTDHSCRRSICRIQTGQIVVQDIYIGRNMKGIKRGSDQEAAHLGKSAQARELHRFHGSHQLRRFLHAEPGVGNGAGRAGRLRQRKSPSAAGACNWSPWMKTIFPSSEC